MVGFVVPVLADNPLAYSSLCPVSSYIVILVQTFMCPRSITGVLFDSVTGFGDIRETQFSGSNKSTFIPIYFYIVSFCREDF